MAPSIKASQTIVAVVAALCLTCACGIGYKQPPQPPPPPIAPLTHPIRVSFPETPVGSISPEQEVTISNNNPVDYALSAIEIYRTVNHAFRIASTTCSNHLAPHGSCTVRLLFQPTTYIAYKKMPARTYGILVVHVTNHQNAEVYLEGTATPAASLPSATQPSTPPQP